MQQQAAIFISYRRGDAAGHAGRLHDRLKLWFDESALFFDVTSIESGEIFPERIAAALRSARAVLVLVGPDWLAEINRRALLPVRDFVRLEIELALQRQSEESPPKLIPVLLGGAQPIALEGLHESLRAGLSRLCDFNAHELPQTRGWDDQFVALRTLLAAVPGVPAPRFRPPPGESRPFRCIDHVPSPHFHDPRQELAKVRAALLARGSAAIVVRAALYGMGGIGKTQLALKYSFEYRDGYAGVWWLRAETETTLQLDARAACVEVGVAPVDGELPAASFKRWLERQPQAWLLVFDNAETLDSLRSHLPQAGPHHVLITSRDPAWGSVAQRIELAVWSEEEGADFLSTRLSGVQRADLLQLSRVLGGLPLALEQAAGWLEQTAGSVADYCKQIEAVDTAALALDEGRIGTGYERSVFATLSLAYQRLSEPARLLLRLCAFFGPEPIPERYFREGGEHLPQPLAAAASEPRAWERTIAELRRLGIAQRTSIASLERAPGELQPDLEQALVLHRLTLEVARHAVSIAAEDGPRVQLLLRWQCRDDPNDPKGWPRFAALLPHLGTFERFRVCDWLDRRLQSWMLDSAASYLRYGPAFYVESERLYRAAIELDRADLGDEHPDTLTSMNNLAGTLWNQGDLPRARVLKEQVLSIRCRVLGEEHPDTLTSMNDLASTLWTQGDLAGARALEEQVLSIRRRVLKEEHPDTLTSMANLAGTLRDQGDVAGARVLQEQVVSIRRRVLGEEHPHTLTSMNNLAGTLQNQGDLAGARVLVEQVLAIRYRVLGGEHPDTLTSMNNLAHTLWSLGALDAAITLMCKAAEGLQTKLGAHHPHTKVAGQVLESWRAARS